MVLGLIASGAEARGPIAYLGRAEWTIVLAMSRSTRLLALLQEMRGRRAPITARDLAEKLDVSEGTIFRDIATPRRPRF